MSDKLQSIFCIGANHKSANLSVREQLFVEPEVIRERIPKTLESIPGVEELCILSTCNRFEVYGVLNGNASFGTAVEVLKSVRNEKSKSSLNSASADDLYENHIYFWTGSQAIDHALRVSSSLDSLIVGETQITGQFKSALQLGRELESVGPVLHRLGQESLANVKKVRTQTDIGTKTVSISHAAIDLAKKVFDDLSKHRILIIGAGEMARLAAQYSLSYKPKNLFIANRTISNAQKLCDRLGGGEAYSLESLDELLLEADIVISSTSSSQYILPLQLVKASQKRRRKTTFLVDIALPRDIDPQIGDLEDVYLFEVDDLKQVVDQNLKDRQRAADQALSIVESSRKNFELWLSTLKIKPALARYRSYLDDLLTQELGKSCKRLSSFGEADRIVLEKMMGSVASKITADLASHLQGRVKAKNRIEDDPDERRQVAQNSLIVEFLEQLTSNYK